MSIRRGPNALAAAAFLLLAAKPIGAKVFLSQEEALRLAFPAGTKVERRTAFLTPSQQTAAAKLARATHPPSALVTFYVGIRDGREIGTAYFDTHVVRTETETLMILIDPAGGIARIEVLSFAEPEEYLPRENWYGQFSGKKLDDALALSGGIRPVAGATLTARATMEAARRVLAIHQAIHEKAPGP
ncbi:MAG TPA: FMN-binding protein [Thermoanaerobaculia bacterium]